jgi:hypothetical protein
MSTALIHADIRTCQSPTFSLISLLNWVLDSACALLFVYNSLFITFSDLAHFHSFTSSFRLIIQRLPDYLFRLITHVTISTRMRQYITFARIFSVLSIINFALAAPVVVREVPEVHVNEVDVAEDSTAASQKRWEPWNDWLTNVADHMSVPTIPAPRRLQDLQDLNHYPRSTESNSAPSSPASSTGPRTRSPPGDSLPPSPGPIDDLHPPFYSSPPGASSPPGSDGSISADHSPAPAPAPSHWSPPSTSLTNPPAPLYSPPGASASPEPVGSPPTDHPPAPPPPYHWSPPSASPSPEPDVSPLTEHSPAPAPNPGHSPPTLTPASSTGPHQSTVDHPLSSSEASRPTEPETKDFLSQLGVGPSHPAEPETEDFLGQPAPGPSHPAEPETKDFLGLLMKDKIKRRSSGSGAGNSASQFLAPVL